MSSRSLIYWLVCAVVAAMAAHAAEPTVMETPALVLPPASSSATILPVPEPGRAVMLFLGVMAMAFTYRRVWLNWKRAS